ncbi:MAG: dipeptide epimerase [Bacteroidota bacterium]
MRLHYSAITLQLSETFTIAHDQRSEQEALIVGLQWRDHLGIGQSTASKYYQVSLSDMITSLEQARASLEEIGSSPLPEPEDFWQSMYPLFAENPFALSALDMAYHDLFAKVLGKPLYELWGLTPLQAPLSNYTIGMGSSTEMADKMKATPWPLYKIKLGTSEDLHIIQALREITDVPFRVDANCAWKAQTTKELAPKLKALGVEFIEQPLKANDWTGMKTIYPNSPLPYLADESCKTEEDVEKCHGYFHGINIKLPKCGGLTPARRMIKKARELQMKVMVGCMTESIVGISAICQLAPLLDYVDVDGAMLVSNDIAQGVQISQGKIHYTNLPGTGAALTPAFQAKLLAS